MVVGVHNLDFAYKQVANSTNHRRHRAHPCARIHKTLLCSPRAHTFLITFVAGARVMMQPPAKGTTSGERRARYCGAAYVRHPI
jgi:hypothetical protein